jgi:hypothetical protein
MCDRRNLAKRDAADDDTPTPRIWINDSKKNADGLRRLLRHVFPNATEMSEQDVGRLLRKDGDA